MPRGRDNPSSDPLPGSRDLRQTKARNNARLSGGAAGGKRGGKSAASAVARPLLARRASSPSRPPVRSDDAGASTKADIEGGVQGGGVLGTPGQRVISDSEPSDERAPRAAGLRNQSKRKREEDCGPADSAGAVRPNVVQCLSTRMENAVSGEMKSPSSARGGGASGKDRIKEVKEGKGGAAGSPSRLPVPPCAMSAAGAISDGSQGRGEGALRESAPSGTAAGVSLPTTVQMIQRGEEYLKLERHGISTDVGICRKGDNTALGTELYKEAPDGGLHRLAFGDETVRAAAGTVSLPAGSGVAFRANGDIHHVVITKGVCTCTFDVIQGLEGALGRREEYPHAFVAREEDILRVQTGLSCEVRNEGGGGDVRLAWVSSTDPSAVFSD